MFFEIEPRPGNMGQYDFHETTHKIQASFFEASIGFP
jgi:hypothetical protein